MRADRWLILAALFLGGGLWVLLHYCHGTAGFNFALPISGTSLSVDIKTMGAPALIGLPLFVVGVVLFVVAIVSAVVAQFRRPPVMKLSNAPDVTKTQAN
ncbi:MAG TPA: hypothetical protein VKB38_14790 [Terracidiphilus sp.]|nr:hypothetical protein [Terracidiphilus sp.]